MVDDLRRKIIHRSLDLFNKEMKFKKTITKYQDFQDHVTDHDLIEGASKVGVIGWEGRKVLHHARDARNIFYGHPTSTEPNVFKVLSLISDCNKYVLSQPYSIPIIDIDTYLTTMDSQNFDRNDIAVEQALSDLPSVYKTELGNKIYTAYVHDSSSTELRSNIEFCFPILWAYLPKEDRQQLGKRLDRNIAEGNADYTEKGIELLTLNENGLRYVSPATRRMIFQPAIERLKESLDDWAEEAQTVANLERLGTSIPDEYLPDYVSALTLTFVGYKGSSFHYHRSDFYSNAAAPVIRRLFERFDHTAAAAFVDTVKTNSDLRWRIAYPMKLNRLRYLAEDLLQKPNLRQDIEDFLTLILDKDRTDKFYQIINSRISKKKK